MWYEWLIGALLVYLLICGGLYAMMEHNYKSGKVVALEAPKYKWVYYLLQFTWGLPMNIAGLAVAAVLVLRGRRPVPYHWGWCFEREGNWGLELGIFFIAPPDSIHTKDHEFGHGVQNVYLGWFTPVVVSLPSVARFWWRKLKKKLGKSITTGYDDIWFEGQATKTGEKFRIERKEEA